MEAKTPASSRRLIVHAVCTLLALPILYVTGSGPLLSLSMKWNGDQSTIGKRVLEIYHPLLQMKQTNPLLPAWRAYLGLWGLHSFRVPLGIRGDGMLILFRPLSPGEHQRYYSPSSATPAP